MGEFSVDFLKGSYRFGANLSSGLPRMLACWPWLTARAASGTTASGEASEKKKK
jgi:hypothetical protein